MRCSGRGHPPRIKSGATLSSFKASGYLVKTFLKHNVIFSEGSRGEHAYVLTQGRVEISGVVSGRKKVFAVLKPISIFGEMALFLEDQQRTATAMALEDCKVVVVAKDDLDRIIESSPPILSTLLNVLVHRLKTATKKALKSPNVPMSVCRALDLMGQHGVTAISYEPTVRALAEMFVLHAEQIENYLAGLEEKGLIRIEVSSKGSRTIHLKDANFLDAFLKRLKEDE